ncbi:hypothetical protein [Bacteroides neonati]|uniref:hypothetical protein n=1 Tax=Bacteroides neonati TaxID=1347393 RepID=UPI0004B328F7|nr:hypothetical protein [Bacteroides neonati]
MIFNLDNPHEHAKYKEYVNKMFQQRAVVEVKKRLPNRTLAQNSYLHLILSFFACETGYSLEEVKLDYFKKACNRDLFERKKVNKQGVEITHMRSSSELTTGEMTTAIERFRNYSSAQAGIYLPAPNENQFLIHIQQEIERNKEFI